MASLSPETSDRFADRDVGFLSMFIHVARVIYLCDSRRINQVNLTMCEGFQRGQLEVFGEGVDFCVFEQLGAGVVDGGEGGVRGESAGGEFGGEVFACVEVFEHAGGGF